MHTPRQKSPSASVVGCVVAAGMLIAACGSDGRGEGCEAAGSAMVVNTISVPAYCRTRATRSQTIEDEATFTGLLRICDGVSSGVDWSSERVVLVYRQQDPNVSVKWIGGTSDEILIGAEVQQYCLGAPPEDGFAFVRLPADGRPWTVRWCFRGSCSGPPKP